MGKLNGSTLVEVIIAMVIITVSFTVGIMVIETSLNSNRTAIKYRANLSFEQIAQEVNQGFYLTNEIIDSTNFWIEKKITPWKKENSHLFILNLKAFDKNNKQIITRSELVYVP